TVRPLQEYVEAKSFVRKVIGKTTDVDWLTTTDEGQIVIVNNTVSIQVFVFDIAGLNGAAHGSIGGHIIFQDINTRRRIIEVFILVVALPNKSHHHPSRLSDFRNI